MLRFNFFCIKIVPIRAGAVLRNDTIAWRDKRPSLISLHKLYKEQLRSLSGLGWDNFRRTV